MSTHYRSATNLAFSGFSVALALFLTMEVHDSERTRYSCAAGTADRARSTSPRPRSPTLFDGVIREFYKDKTTVGVSKVKLKQFSYSFVDKHTSFVPVSLPNCPTPHACLAKVRQLCGIQGPCYHEGR